MFFFQIRHILYMLYQCLELVQFVKYKALKKIFWSNSNIINAGLENQPQTLYSQWKGKFLLGQTFHIRYRMMVMLCHSLETRDQHIHIANAIFDVDLHCDFLIGACPLLRGFKKSTLVGTHQPNWRVVLPFPANQLNVTGWKQGTIFAFERHGGWGRAPGMQAAKMASAKNGWEDQTKSN